jgi:hypothetical protein
MSDERQNFVLEFTTPQGESVIVTVEYPAEKGLLGVRALRESNTDKYIDQVLQTLLDAGDGSTLKSYDDFVISEIEEAEQNG